MRRIASATGVVALVVACGGPASPASSPASENPSERRAVPADEEQSELPSAEQQAESSGESVAEQAADDASASEDKPEPRRVRYLMSSEGLQVEVDGLSMTATAEPVQVEGGWGVRVKVKGQVIDDADHSFLWPERGPMAFAGAVQRGAGESSRFGDKRETEGEKVFGPGQSFEASRSWPGDIDVKPLKAGDSVDLEVGLWGFGSDADSRRPMRDFLLIRMKAGKHEPQPVVQPPASATR